MCGLIAFSSELHATLNGSPRNFSVGAGIWTSVFFVVSGGLAIGGARSGSKCLVVSTMMMSIISAVCAGGLLIASSTGWDINTYGPNSYYSSGVSVTGYVLLVLMGLTMLIVAIISASLTCKPLCCRPVKQELVSTSLCYISVEI